MYAAKSTAHFCIISTVVLMEGSLGVFFCAGNDVDLGRK